MKDDKYRVALVLMGPPASGKGTISSYFGAIYGASMFCPGEEYATFRRGDGELNRLCDSLLSEGRYCPSWLTNQMATVAAEKLYGAGAPCIVMDGYPRDLEQWGYLQTHFEVGAYLHLESDYEALCAAACARRSCKHCGKVFSTKEPPPISKAVNAFCPSFGVEPLANRGGTYSHALDCAMTNKKNWLRRPDDTAEMYAKRYATHKELTQPVIDLAAQEQNYLRADLIGGKDTAHTILEQLKQFSGLNAMLVALEERQRHRDY